MELSAGANPTDWAVHLGLEYEEPIGALDNHFLFSGLKRDIDVVAVLRRRMKSKKDVEFSNQVLFHQKQVTKGLVRRAPPLEKRQFGVNMPQASNPELVQRQDFIRKNLTIDDPMFREQWHLLNVIDKGHDLNVTGLWLEDVTGQGATVAIVDDGIDMYSEDIKENYFAKGSYDFNDHNPEPRPRLSDDHHGTRCAGEIAAVKNNICGVGVAWKAKVAGIRILSKVITDADEAIALNYGYQDNHIYSCSWGPPDDGKSMEAPGILIKKAILKGIEEGRGGLGSVFVFASGNGAAAGDNCNFDGYTNSIYSITVGAIDRKGIHPYYSEQCSAQMVVTYSSGSGDAIHTTDINNECYTQHGGTSAAAPLAAGVYALLLSVRPDLSWRDVQYLSMITAIPLNDHDGAWVINAAGRKYSHRYGYGKLDAYALIQAAKPFKTLNPQTWYHSPLKQVNGNIPQGPQGLKSEIEITADHLRQANLSHVEHVTVFMNANHTRRGDLSLDLISPKGVISHLSVERSNDDSGAGYRDWNFMTVAHWGEDGVGNWTVVIRDEQINTYSGALVDWSISLWGESTENSKMHNSGLWNQTHPYDIENSSNTTEAGDTENAAFLPSFLPTFGVSAKTQGWMYGSFIVIVGFIIVVAVFLVKQRRKQQSRQDTMNYEFESLNNEDVEEGTSSGPRQGGASGGRRKARDLYDAFGASDDEMFNDDGEHDESEIDEKDYDSDEARGIDEGPRTGDRQKLLGREQQ